MAADQIGTLSGKQEEMDPLKTFVLERALHDPHSLQSVPTHLIEQTDWFRSIVLEVWKHHPSTFSLAKDAPSLAADNVTRRGMGLASLEEEQATIIQQLVRYYPPQTRPDPSLLSQRKIGLVPTSNGNRRVARCDLCGDQETIEGFAILSLGNIQTIRAAIGTCGLDGILAKPTPEELMDAIYRHGRFVDAR